MEGVPAMRTHRARTVVVVVVVALLTSCTAERADPDRRDPSPVRPGPVTLLPSPGDGRVPDPIETELQRLLDEVVANEARNPGLNRGAPGLAVAIVGDEWTWAGSAGLDGTGTPVQPDSMMAIGGITKTFVAAEVLHLASTGVVDLEARVSQYVDHPEAENGAIVEQALGLRAGFRDRPLLRAASADPARHWDTAEVLDVLVASSDAPAVQPFMADAGYVMLARIIEETTGTTLGRAIRSDLLTPAGLDRLVIQDEEVPRPPVAAPVSAAPLPPADGYLPFRSSASLAGGAGGMAGDAPTLARWGYLLYGGHVLDEPWIVRLTDPAEPDLVPGIRYGLGTMVIKTSYGHEAVGHFGEVVGYTGALFVVPDRSLSIAVLAVRDGFSIRGLVERLTTAALPEG